MNEENNNGDLLEQQAKKVKQALLKKIKIYAIKTIAFIIIIALIAGIFLSVLNTVGKTVKAIVNAVTDFFSIDTDGAIVITDEQIDEIINGIVDLGIDMDGLKLMGDIDYSNPDIQAEYLKQKRKFIREFYEAQAMTQTLNTNPNWIEELASGGKPYGTVYVSRETKDTTDPTQKNSLKYIPYTEMMKKIEDSSGAVIESDIEEANKKDIINYFSIDEEGKLVIAGWENTIVKENGIMISKQTQIKKTAIDYKSAVAQYTTPMHFLICLAMVSENPEFVLAVTDLVKRSDIRISLMDIKAKDISTETHTYIENIKTRREVEHTSYDAWDTEHQFPYTTYSYEETVTQEPREDIIETTTTSQSPMVAITYAKTWFSEQTITYNKTTEGPTTTLGEPMDGAPDDPEPIIEGEGTESWITDRKVRVDTESTKEKYVEGVRGDVIDKTGERGSPGIKDLNANGVVDKGETTEDLNGNGVIDLPEKVDEDTTFMGLLDAKFKIPNSTRYDSAAGNVKSGSGILFFLLQQDASTQNLEQLMRYVLNKYDNNPNKYGNVNKEDLFSSFNARMLSTGENYVVNTTMSPKELCITQEEALKAAIAKLYTGKMKENLMNEVKNFLAMQEKYNVNAVFAMAVTIIESSAGTNWSAIDSSTYNWYSITGSYKGHSYRDPNSSNPRTWRKYPSFKEATFDFGDLIANSPYYYRAGRYSVEQIAPVYCNEEWGKVVRSIMNEIYTAAGLETIAEEAKIGGVTTDTEAAQLQNYIETSLLHTKPHKGTGLYQNGPFATWWSVGYNSLQKFQCTWWANGRASMYLQQHGTKYKRYPTQLGHGGQYFEINKSNGWFKYGNTPKPNSIISWSSGSYGHVAYVEGVTSDGIYISHAGNGDSWYGIQKIPLNGSLGSGYSLNGYIYLGEPN